MSKKRPTDSSNETKYCPFKKAVSTEYNGNNDRKELHERFEQCAGERCMAYTKYGECARIDKH